jgi:TonB dependent receptor
LTGNPVGESFERYRGGFAVGGPIVKDKTFFYANFEYTRDKNNQLVDAPQLGETQNVTGNNEFLLGSVRLDHRFNEGITATLRGNFSRVTIERPGGGLGGGNNPFPSAGSDEFRPQSFGTSQNFLAFYLEDEWQVTSKLTATAGLRGDYDSLTGNGGTGGDYNDIAPRRALNFRPDSRSSFRFGAGLIYSKIIYSVISDALQRNTTSPACATASTCPPPSAVQALRNTAIINEARILNPRGYDSPYSLQLSGGYQYQVNSTITAGIDLIYSRTRNLVRLRDLNTPTSFIPNVANLTAANIAALRALPDNASRIVLAQQLGLARTSAAAGATRPVALVPGGARQITVSETEGKSLYRAVNLQVNKVRGDDDYALRFSYTLSKLTNNTDDINFRASNANNFSVDNGPSANDRRHVISAVGFLYPIRGLTATGALLFQSGQPVNLVPDASVFGTQDLNGDG